MALKIEKKKTIVAEVRGAATKAISAATAHYRGLTVTQMTKLRADARSKGVHLKVVRNTLARKALEGTHFECLRDTLVGPIILALTDKEPSAPARLFRDFMKENEKFEVKGLAISGKLYGVKDLENIASLPTRDEAIAILMAALKAPITKFVRTLVEPHAKFVRTLAAVRDQKQ